MLICVSKSFWSHTEIISDFRSLEVPSLVLVTKIPRIQTRLHPKQVAKNIMSGRRTLFVSAESIPGGYDKVTLRAYLGGDAVVTGGEHAV